jgi:hypothetical protein
VLPEQAETLGAGVLLWRGYTPYFRFGGSWKETGLRCCSANSAAYHRDGARISIWSSTMWTIRFLIPVVCLFALTESVSADLVYDLRTEWSDLANPNGAWSYREGDNLLPHAADWQGLEGDFTGVQPAWARAETGTSNLPAWFKIASAASIPHDWQLGDIVVHTTDTTNGIGSGPANVIWTSPFDGTIDISGHAWMGRDIGRGNQWELSVNGTPLTSGSIASGDSFSRASPFSFAAGSGGPAVLSQIPVDAGDIVRLQLAKTSTFGDYVGVNFTIDATAIPEAGSLLFMTALVVVGAARWLARRGSLGSESPLS